MPVRCLRPAAKLFDFATGNLAILTLHASE